MSRRVLLPLLLGALALLGAAGACNSGLGDCPAAQAVQPGASCSDDNLECAYSLSTPTEDCNGSTVVMATSCTCTSGTWACPSAFDCDAGAGGDAAPSADAPEDVAAAADAPSDTAAPDAGASDSAAMDGGAADARPDGDASEQ